MSLDWQSGIRARLLGSSAPFALLLILATLGQGGAEPGSQLGWHAVVVAMMVLELSRGVNGGPTWRPERLSALFLGLYFVLAGTGAVFAPYGFAAWLFMLDLASFIGVTWIASRRGPSLLGRLALPLSGVAFLQSVLFLVQRFALGQTRPAGTFLNPNHLAAWLVAVLLFAWGSTGLRDREPTSRWLLPLLTAPALGALALVGSRGAILGMIAGLVVFLGLGWSGLSRSWRRAAVAGGLALVLLSAAGVITRLRQPDPFRYQRLGIWKASLRIAVEQPWLGSGPRQFPYAARTRQFDDGDGPLRFDRGYRSTHSDWLRVPCELGWPGAAVAVALAVSVGLGLIQRRDSMTGAERGAVAALGALVVQSGVENLSARPAVYLLAAALLGPLIARRGTAWVSWPMPFKAAAGVLLLLVFVIGDVGPYLAWREVRGLPEGRLDASQQARLAKALHRNPVHPEYWRRWAAHLSQSGAGWNRETYAEARESAERAIRLHRADAMGFRALARVEASACRRLFGDVATRERASAAYAEAERLDPFNPFLPLERAGFLLDAGDAEGAVASARRALELEPEAVAPRLLLAGAVLAADGHHGKARALELLDEAHRQAERWKDWKGTGLHAEELLRIDPSDEARLRRALSDLPAGTSG